MEVAFFIGRKKVKQSYFNSSSFSSSSPNQTIRDLVVKSKVSDMNTFFWNGSQLPVLCRYVGYFSYHRMVSLAVNINYLFSLKNSLQCWDLNLRPPESHADALPIDIPYKYLHVIILLDVYVYDYIVYMTLCSKLW